MFSNMFVYICNGLLCLHIMLYSGFKRAVFIVNVIVNRVHYCARCHQVLGCGQDPICG